MVITSSISVWKFWHGAICQAVVTNSGSSTETRLKEIKYSRTQNLLHSIGHILTFARIRVSCRLRTSSDRTYAQILYARSKNGCKSETVVPKNLQCLHDPIQKDFGYTNMSTSDSFKIYISYPANFLELLLDKTNSLETLLLSKAEDLGDV